MDVAYMRSQMNYVELARLCKLAAAIEEADGHTENWDTLKGVEIWASRR